MEKTPSRIVSHHHPKSYGCRTFPCKPRPANPPYPDQRLFNPASLTDKNMTEIHPTKGQPSPDDPPNRSKNFRHSLQKHVIQVTQHNDKQGHRAEKDADELPCHDLFEQRGLGNR